MGFSYKSTELYFGGRSIDVPIGLLIVPFFCLWLLTKEFGT